MCSPRSWPKSAGTATSAAGRSAPAATSAPSSTRNRLRSQSRRAAWTRGCWSRATSWQSTRRGAWSKVRADPQPRRCCTWQSCDPATRARCCIHTPFGARFCQRPRPKGLDGVGTHEHRERLPIVENTQDWTAAAPRIEAMLRENPGAHGFLIRGHGLYTWGQDLAEARRQIEILEFLFEVMGRKRGMAWPQ